jgi:hypothetical protein
MKAKKIKIWKERVTDYFNALRQYLPGGTVGEAERTLVRIANKQ